MLGIRLRLDLLTDILLSFSGEVTVEDILVPHVVSLSACVVASLWALHGQHLFSGCFAEFYLKRGTMVRLRSFEIFENHVSLGVKKYIFRAFWASF